MRAEKSIRPPWIDEIDKLEASKLDKTSAWEKLQDKLKDNPNKRNYKWLWWSSASVAAALMIFVLQPTRSKTDIPKETESPTVVIKQPASTMPTHDISKPVFQTPTVPDATDKKDEKRDIEKITPDKEGETIIVTTIDAIQNKIVEKDTLSNQVINSVPVVAKRKTRVVHNNELENTSPVLTPEQPVTARKEPIIFRNLFKPGANENNTIPETNLKEPTIKRPVLPFSGLSQKD